MPPHKVVERTQAAQDVSRDHEDELRNYRLYEQVGQEDLSSVYRATHLTLDRPVLVHLLRRTDWVSVSRFNLAARLSAQLSHPNLLPVIDAGHDDTYGYYLVTPMLEAQALHTLVAAGPLEPVLVLRIATHIAAVLDFLHQQSIIHRDVQPVNIIVTPEGVAYLTGLGLAASPGTPDLSSVDSGDYLTCYTAPEQRLDQSEATPALDVYGLGATLYHLLSGTPPPVAGEPLPSLTTHDPLLREADDVLQRMMAAQPSARFASAGESAAALRRALHAHVDRATDDMEESQWEPAAEWLENPLETVMGDMLNQEYYSRSRSRADSLHRTESLRRLLNRWSRKGFFRRSLLGQVIQFDQIVSYNIYFYKLRTLYETRTPFTPRQRSARPEEHQTNLPPLPPVWDFPVPAEDNFATVPMQEMVLPEHRRILPCTECEGAGQVRCTTCEGEGNIQRSRKVRQPDNSVQVETHQEMCPTCRGYRLQRCPTCAGTGNLVEEHVFTWGRSVCLWENTDDLEELPHKAIHQRAEEVYHASINPYEGRWHSVAPLSELLRSAINDVKSEDTRIIKAELHIHGTPLTEIDYHIDEKSYRLFLIGHDNEVVGEGKGWVLLNIDRIIWVVVAVVLLIIVAVAVAVTVI